MFCKYLSKEDLKTSTATPLRLRTSGGSELNSLGPLCGREAKRIFLIRSGAEDDRGGGTHERPLRWFSSVTIGVDSKFGTCPSMIFQIYITW